MGARETPSFRGRIDRRRDRGRAGRIRRTATAETRSAGGPAGRELRAGPAVRAFFAGQTIDGISFPTPSQPVQGFSAIVAGRQPGEYLAMPDNGFGNQANSADFLLRAYFIRPDFKMAKHGTGTVAVGDFVQFSDPNNVIGFPIQRPDRLLTGADLDPESLQRGKRSASGVRRARPTHPTARSRSPDP